LTLHYLPISEENPEPAETFHLTIEIEPGSGILESEGETVTITDMDNGKPVALHIGDTLRIELEANATTGYEWSLGLVDPSIVQQRGEPEYIGPEQALPGAGGTSVWTFEAVRSGTTQLVLHYARPFETDVEPIQVFEITVDVE
jgi:inhibitor of cysteine peptidase